MTEQQVQQVQQTQQPQPQPQPPMQPTQPMQPMQPMQPVQVPVQPVQMVQPPQPPQPPQMPQPMSGMQPPQHTPVMDPNASIIDQLRAQNAALMQRNDELNAQVVRMVQGGAQFQQAQQPAHPVQHVPAQFQQTPEFPNYYEPYQPPISLTQPVDYSMESLGREIGKKDSNE